MIIRIDHICALKDSLIRVRSGEYGGRKSIRHPVGVKPAWIHCRSEPAVLTRSTKAWLWWIQQLSSTRTEHHWGKGFMWGSYVCNRANPRSWNTTNIELVCIIQAFYCPSGEISICCQGCAQGVLGASDKNISDLCLLALSSPAKLSCICTFIFACFIDNNKLRSITNKVCKEHLLEFLVSNLISLCSKFLKHLSGKSSIIEGSRQCQCQDWDLVFDCKPSADFIKKEIGVLSIELYNGIENCMSNFLCTSDKRWWWAIDFTMFFKDLSPAVTTASWDSQGITGVFNIPALVPKSKSTLFEVLADWLIDHCSCMVDIDGQTWSYTTLVPTVIPQHLRHSNFKWLASCDNVFMFKSDKTMG